MGRPQRKIEGESEARRCLAKVAAAGVRILDGRDAERAGWSSRSARTRPCLRSDHAANCAGNAALHGLACPAAAVHAVPRARLGVAHVRDSELLLPEPRGVLERGDEHRQFLGSGTEAAIVIEDVPEEAHAVLVVRTRVEHVQVPHAVDGPRGREGNIRVPLGEE